MAEGSGGNLNLGQSALYRELRQYMLSGESVESDSKRGYDDHASFLDALLDPDGLNKILSIIQPLRQLIQRDVARSRPEKGLPKGNKPHHNPVHLGASFFLNACTPAYILALPTLLSSGLFHLRTPPV